MPLSEEEKQRIYEEEKARAEAKSKVEEDIKKEQKKKTNKATGIGCVIVLAAILVIVLLTLSGPNQDGQTPADPAIVDLRAVVGFDGLQFQIANRDTFDWINVELEVNSGLLRGGFTYKAEIMEAESEYTIGALQFSKGDGTRLNPVEYKVKKFNIWCDLSSGRNGQGYFEWN